MKRLLAFFTPLLLMVSCTKDTDFSLGGDISGEAVSFTASMEDITQSRATLKNAWSGGEEIALFVDDDDTVYHFTVAADGSMSGDEVAVVASNEYTYTAFYPYNVALKTVTAYEAACIAGEVDYLKAEKTASGNVVSLQFAHQMAALTFAIEIDSSLGTPAISLALGGNISSAVALDVEYIGIQYIANYFVPDNTDISSAILAIIQSDESSYYFTLKQDEASNIVEAGKQYPFPYTIERPTGSGIASDPYIVYTADDMRKVGTGTDDWGLSRHYKLANNIDLGGIDEDGNGVEDNMFTSIGAQNSTFTGSFDGNGYEISGLYINKSAGYQGLFGNISGATIKNLGVSGSINISGSYSNTAGIVGYATSYSNVINCYNRASVKGSYYVGGIVGQSVSSTISNCYNTGSVDGTYSRDGGIVGFSNSSTISNCYNTGSVKGSSNIGGVVGYGSSSKLNNCYSTGSVTGTVSSYIGGVLGRNYSSTISYCYYDSDVVTGVTGAVGISESVEGTNDGTNYCGLTTTKMKGTASTSGTLLYYLTNSSYGSSSEWTSDTKSINNGYPILTWQE